MKKIIATLGCTAVVGVLAGASQAQPLVSEQPMDTVQPFSLQSFAQDIPLCAELETGSAAVRSVVAKQLMSGTLLSLPADYFLKSESMDGTAQTSTISIQDLTEEQAKMLSTMLVAAAFAKEELNDYAPPENLSETQLCALRDSCYVLIDALEEQKYCPLTIDGKDTPTVQTLRLGILISERLTQWTETYCPVSERRQFEKDHKILSRCFVMELKGDAQPYLDQLDEIAEQAIANNISYSEAYEQIWNIWRSYSASKW